MTLDLNLLKTLCSIHAPSGSEYKMKTFLLDYIEQNAEKWAHPFKLVHGEDFQDCIILIFGTPRTAIYAHMDSVGYTVGYNNNLIKIGGPKGKSGTMLSGHDSNGPIRGELQKKQSEGIESLSIKFDRTIDRATTLVYEQEFIANDKYIQSCYLDNRLGIYNALKVAETLKDGAIVFSSWEEVGGGSVGYLGKYLYENYNVKQSLISDITWITEGVKHGEGVAISSRDSGIPRKKYIDKIIALAKASEISFQIEVESAGGSDGNALQKSSYPIDWCFIGAGESNVHQPNELVHISDVKSMISLYKYLMDKL